MQPDHMIDVRRDDVAVRLSTVVAARSRFFTWLKVSRSKLEVEEIRRDQYASRSNRTARTVANRIQMSSQKDQLST